MNTEHGAPRRIIIHHPGLERSIAALQANAGKNKMTRLWIELDPQLIALLMSEALHVASRRGLKINEALTALVSAALLEVLGVPLL
jgi:hypothetical protein